MVSMDDSYDLSMTFCRIQEFYESPFKEIKGKRFSMMQFQKLYSKKLGNGVFTYPEDWAGFNIPSNTIKRFRRIMWESNGYDDWNEYDDIFDIILSEIEKKIKKNQDYYLIGVNGSDQETIDHEVSHALYYLYPTYKKEADKITDRLSKKTKEKIENWLLNIGYNKSSLKDELQAYISSDEKFGNFNISLNEEKKIKNLSAELKKLKENWINKN